MPQPDNVSSKIGNIVSAWAFAKARVHEAEKRLEEARKELLIANNTAHLTPDDAKAGERFNLWYADGLLGVIVTHPPPEEGGPVCYEIFWRKEPSPRPKMNFNLT
jgi:hypothetical protein